MKDNKLDTLSWRLDFPALSQANDSQSLIAYLDTASSAQKPRQVIDCMNDVLLNHYANIHRGLYEYSAKTTELFENVRDIVASFIGVQNSDEIIFTRNSTEAINLVAQSWGRKFLDEGDEIIISEMEHHANIVPWQLLHTETGINIKVIPVKDDGTLDIQSFEKLLTHKTKFISLVHISNATGVINDIKTVIDVAKDFYPDIKILIDGSQAVVHEPVNVSALGCDFYVFTSHKLYGPTGAGVLWGRFEILNAMPPYQGGGDMIDTVTFTHTTFKPPPSKFEAGTPAIVEVIGLGEAINYISSIGIDNIKIHEQQMYQLMRNQLKDIEGIRFFGDVEDKAGILSFTVEWGHSSDIAMILDQCGVCVRTGHHCCMPLLEKLGVESTIRASVGLYTNEDDIQSLFYGLEKAKSILQ